MNYRFDTIKMNINKTCSCGTALTTKNIKHKDTTMFGYYKMLWYDCKSCGSTGVLKLIDPSHSKALLNKIHSYFNENYDDLRKDYNNKLCDQASKGYNIRNKNGF